MIFHIGTNKAGSTTIQGTLAHHSEKLLDHGFYYPFLQGHIDHTRLLFAFTDDDEFPKHHRRDTTKGSRATRTYAEKLWAELEASVRAYTPKALILSTEFGVGLRTKSFERLVAHLRRWSAHVELVLYFRSPARHYLSAVQQGVKFGDQIKNPRLQRIYRKQYSKVAGWQTDKLTVRAFERKQLIEGCVCRDFLTEGVGLSKELANEFVVRRRNESVSAEAMALLQAFNRVHFPGRRRPGNRLSAAFARSVRAATGKGYARPSLRDGLKKTIENDLQDEMSWLCDTTGIRFSDFPYGTPHPVDDEMRDLRARFDRLLLSDVVRVDEAKFVELKRAVLDECAKAHLGPVSRPTPRFPLAAPVLDRWQGLRLRAELEAVERLLLFKHRCRQEWRHWRRGLPPALPDIKDVAYYHALRELLSNSR